MSDPIRELERTKEYGTIRIEYLNTKSFVARCVNSVLFVYNSPVNWCRTPCYISRAIGLYAYNRESPYWAVHCVK